MQRYTPIRLALALTFFEVVGPCVPGIAQGAPLFSKHSAATPAASSVATVDVPKQLSPSQQPARRAEVSFAQGQLAVKADNSSLNQILREIGHQTGIKITGGVTEERVFGNYGPAPTAQVLAALLEGTSSNLLLLHSEAGTPGELILTPRQGGVTPPNPNAPGFDDESSGEDNAQPQVAEPAQPAPPQPAPGAGPNNPQGAQANPAQPGTATPAATDAPTDPNAVKTPQQIYEQLQRLRQQQSTAPQ